MSEDNCQETNNSNLNTDREFLNGNSEDFMSTASKFKGFKKNYTTLIPDTFEICQ